MKNQTPWPRLTKVKMSKLGDVLSKRLILNHIKNGCLGDLPPKKKQEAMGVLEAKLLPAGRFLEKSYFSAIGSHFARV